jgi:hypothetical protein
MDLPSDRARPAMQGTQGAVEVGPDDIAARFIAVPAT